MIECQSRSVKGVFATPTDHYCDLKLIPYPFRQCPHAPQDAIKDTSVCSHIFEWYILTKFEERSMNSQHSYTLMKIQLFLGVII